MIADTFNGPEPKVADMRPVEIKFEGGEPLGIYLVNQENPHAVSAVRKIARQARPGALVMLTQAEIDALANSNDFRKFA